MNFRLITRVLGGLLLFLAVGLFVPLPVSLIFGDGTWPIFAALASACAVAGVFLFRLGPAGGSLGAREGAVIVTLAWVVYGFIGGLPFALSGHLPSLIDSTFESISGFTTTGASVLRDIEAVQPAVLFWRALTQWLGGMGIIVLGIAILPFLGIGGMQLFQAEVAGPTADRLSPRIQDTAKALWGTYLFFTAAQTVLLMFGGMGWFDAVCHSFTTLASGGFSTKNASMGAWSSAYLHWVTILFMLIAGTNFTLHWYALRGQPAKYLRSFELRVYLGVFALATVVIAWMIGYEGNGIERSVRDAAFQVASIGSSTGFATRDYEAWPFLAQGILVALTFTGACAGSTSGGMKLARAIVAFRYAYHQLFLQAHPRGVKVLKLDGKIISPEIVQGIFAFLTAYLTTFGLGTLAVAATGVDLLTGATAVITCMSNVGPGLGSVGPAENFAGLPQAAKLILSALMLLGRLELFTVLVLLLPSFWRR